MATSTETTSSGSLPSNPPSSIQPPATTSPSSEAPTYPASSSPAPTPSTTKLYPPPTTTTTAPSGTVCEFGWEYFGPTHSCYKNTTKKYPLDQAEKVCTSAGAKLASVESLAEYGFLNRMFFNIQKIWIL
uniref:C-type lectin domain-containing protein n=1 Tax=Panagrolaimus sp. ES5 TaxID=591445 RepID=A0AC34GXI8_9BILA